MNEKMTVISSLMFERASSGTMSVPQAVKMLRDCTQFRTLSAKLGAFAKGRNIRELLTQGLAENHPEIKRESLDKKVRNWLSDRQNSIQKSDAFELCFILGLDADESDSLLAMISEEGFHWRDPDEIPYIYALMNGLTFSQAKALDERIRQQIKEKTASGEDDEEAFTAVIREKILNIKDEEELIRFVAEESSRLGRMHNTAYSLFCGMMEKLESPEVYRDDDYFPENRKYTAGQIVSIYLHREDIPENTDNKKKALYSALQKSVSANWPDESVLSRIKNRKSNITRKTLILLFLATYDADDGREYDYDDEETEMTRDEIFREFYMSINTMLMSCGFNPLDPRNPFDWMIIFCMGAEDFWEVDNTLSEFLHTLFSDEAPGNDLQNI